MARPPGKVNYVKLVDQAQRSKSKVKQNKIAAYHDWQKKLGKKSKGLDKLDDKLRKLHDDLQKAEKKRADDKKALERFGRMVEGALKELQVYKSVPVPGKLPPPPKNITAISSLTVVVVAMIAYLALVKAYMATAEALSKDK